MSASTISWCYCYLVRMIEVDKAKAERRGVKRGWVKMAAVLKVATYTRSRILYGVHPEKGGRYRGCSQRQTKRARSTLLCLFCSSPPSP